MGLRLMLCGVASYSVASCCGRPPEGTPISALQIILLCLLAVPGAYLVLICAYLTVITLGAWLYRIRANYSADPLRGVILIPAHDEAENIRYILSDANTLDYPPSKFSICVIADNCSDDTAKNARETGVNVFERHDLSHRGKGQALDWCLREHKEFLAGHDFIALVDADMTIHPRFLREMSASFSAGAQVVQGLNTVARPESTWRTALGFIGFSVINHVRPSGRCFFGGTAELKGSGMAFRAPLLLKYGWPAHSLAEDAEFSKQLLLDGIVVDYNPRALVTSEIPTTTYQARIQQARWEGGKWYLQKTYVPILLKALFKRPSIARLDALLDILVPPQSLLVMLIAGCFATSIFIHPGLAIAFALCAVSVAFCVLSALTLTRASLTIWLALLAVPFLLIWKLPLYARLLVSKGAQGWQRTPRDIELDQEKNQP